VEHGLFEPVVDPERMVEVEEHRVDARPHARRQTRNASSTAWSSVNASPSSKF